MGYDPQKNAEAQARWREKRNKLAKRAEELEAEVARLRGKASTRPAASGKIAEQLDKHLQALFEQGLKHMATMSPPTVMTEVVRLERLLVEFGVVPPSKRSADTLKYAESIKRRWAREEKAGWDKYQAKVDAERAAKQKLAKSIT